MASFVPLSCFEYLGEKNCDALLDTSLKLLHKKRYLSQEVSSVVVETNWYKAN